MSLTAKYVRTAARQAWGPLNSCKQLPGLKGVYEVDSWGHGGLLVSDELFDLHPALRGDRFRGASWRSTATGADVITFYEFEEDCAWAVLALFHPEVLEALNRSRSGEPIGRQYVADSVARWHADLLPLAPAA